MIYRLTGTLSLLDDRSILVDVSGVGYRLFVSTDIIARLMHKGGETISLWTYMAVRENSMELFGFLEKETLEFFELLISIPGIGPRSGLSIIGIVSPDTLKRAIQSGDTSYLTKVSGIGKKTAEKIVLELRDKLGAQERETGDLRSEAEALEALKAIGYSAQEAREALKQVPAEIEGTNARIKEALKVLGS